MMATTRRDFLGSMSGGLCGAALAYLFGRDLAPGLRATEAPADLKPRAPHVPAKATSVIHLFMNGGPSRPTLGSWVVYGLGSENQNLPAYVVLDDPLGLPINGVENWQAGFLPPQFQGTRFRSTGSPVLNLAPDVARPAGVVQAERGL